MLLYPYKDSDVASGDPDYNTGWSGSMAVETFEGRYWRSYIGFNLASVPEPSRIFSAHLHLTSLTHPKTHRAVFKRVIESWGERDITWNNQPSRSAEHAYIHDIESPHVYDVTELCKDAKAAGDEFGVYIGPYDHRHGEGIRFYTRGESQVRRPYLEVVVGADIFQYQLIFEGAELPDQERKDLLAAEYVKYDAVGNWLVLHSEPDCFDTIRPDLPAGDGVWRTGWLCHGIEFGQSPCYPIPWWACGISTPAVQYFRGECSCDHFRNTLQPLGIPCYHLIKAKKWYGSTVPYCPYIQCP